MLVGGFRHCGIVDRSTDYFQGQLVREKSRYHALQSDALENQTEVQANRSCGLHPVKQAGKITRWYFRDNHPTPSCIGLGHALSPR
jgi:hypothetical protein